MKKIVLLFIVLFGMIFLTKINVSAETVRRFDKKTENKTEKKTEINFLEDQGDYANCDGLFTPDAIELIKEVLNWIRILAPILLIILVALDLSSAVVAQDNDALSKATKKIVPRLIGAALLFFVPTIIRAILSMQGVTDAIVIPDDPLCRTMTSHEVYYDYQNVI